MHQLVSQLANRDSINLFGGEVMVVHKPIFHKSIITLAIDTAVVWYQPIDYRIK
jgi:hypothetical protein